MTRAMVGITKAEPIRAFFSLDPKKFFSYLAIEGKETEPLKDVYESIERCRGNNDPRYFVVVVAGSRGFLEAYLEGLPIAHGMVLIGDVSDLHALGAEVLDEHWLPGKPAIDLGAILLSGKVAGTRRSTPAKRRSLRERLSRAAGVVGAGLAAAGTEIAAAPQEDRHESKAAPEICSNCLHNHRQWRVVLRPGPGGGGTWEVCDACRSKWADADEIESMELLDPDR